MKSKNFPQEGEIWIVKFDKLKEFSKPYRPCLVISNDTQNEFDENVVVYDNLQKTHDTWRKLQTEKRTDL